MRRLGTGIAVVLLALAGASGCTRSNYALPAVDWSEDTGIARQILIDRARSVRTVTATGLLTLTRPDGQSVRFDAALVTAPPDRLRLRAWKLGRAIMDLTLTPEGLWLLSPQDASLRDKVESAGAGAGQIARQWALLSGAFFERDDLLISLEPRSLVLAAEQDDLLLRCYVDRRSLVPRLYTLRDSRGRTRFSLRLDDYRMIGDIPYPRRVKAESDSGTILVQLLEIELNQELTPGAFTPPRRAEKLAEQDPAQP